MRQILWHKRDISCGLGSFLGLPVVVPGGIRIALYSNPIAKQAPFARV